MRLLGLFEEPEGPSARLRFHEFVRDADPEAVAVQGIPRARGPRATLFRAASGFDVVFVQRRLLLPWDLRALRGAARRLVYDFDDALLYRDHAPHASRARRFKLAGWMRVADQVIAGSEELAAHARHLGREAVVVPTVVPPRAPVQGPRDPRELLWVGQPSTLPYLEELVPALRTVAERVPGVRLTVLGGAAEGSLARLPCVRLLPWSREGEELALGRAAVGLAPLPDNPWTRGKCGARLLHYLAAGLRSVAAAVGAQQCIAAACGGVELVLRHQDWAPTLEKVLREGPLPGEEAQRLQERVAAHYSPAAWRSRWWQAVTGVALPPSGR